MTSDQHANPTKPGRDLAVGDVLVYLGERYPVTAIEDYPADSPLHAEQGGPLPRGTRIARSGAPRFAGDAGWGITVLPDHRCEVIA